MEDPLERFKKVHIWIGTVEQNEDDYNKYFEGTYNALESTYYQSQFEKDIAPDDPDYECDEDFLGIIPLLDRVSDITDLLELAVVDSTEYDNLFGKCEVLGVTQGNAIVYYSDGELDFSSPKEHYNGLKYIGLFRSELG